MSSSNAPNLYVEEYLYRGRPPSSGAPGEHHLILGCEIADGFGGMTTHHRGPLTMADAEALGWPLAKITDAISGETADALQKATAELTAVRSERDAAAIDAANYKAALDTANAHIEALKGVVESLRQEIGSAPVPVAESAEPASAPVADEPAPAADR